MISETQLSRSIQRLLRAAGYLVVRVQAGGQRGRLRLADEGTPDLYTSLCGGIWLEVKRPDGKLTSAQKRWHETARAHGVRVEVVRDVAIVAWMIGQERA